jgi:hypothetical protein
MTFGARQVVQGPGRLPARYGMFTVATPREPGDDHWQNGVDWEVDSCAPVRGIGDPTCTLQTYGAFAATTAYTVGQTITVSGSTLRVVQAGTSGATAPTPPGMFATVTSGTVIFQQIQPETVLPTGLPKSFADTAMATLGSATPFTVYATYDCSPVGRSVADMQDKARQRLLSREEGGVEKIFWTGSVGNVPKLQGATVLATAKQMVTALALLEQYAADTWGGPGVIHVPKIGGVVLAQNGVVKPNGNSLETALGSQVIAGSGYPNSDMTGAAAAANTAWAVVTPPMFVYRSSVFTSSSQEGDLLDRGSNTFYAIAERTYLVGYDTCGLAAVNFNLP